MGKINSPEAEDLSAEYLFTSINEKEMLSL